MERVQPRPSEAVAVSALALATASAVSFGLGDAIGFLSDAAEDLFILAWLLGWVLIVWAAIIGGSNAAILGKRWLSRQRISVSEVALVAATFALIAVVTATHPVWGTGSAVGG